MKKFELTTNTKMFLGKKLFQIKALINFGDVEAGELGGYIEKEENLDYDGDAWVSGNACVSDNARVSGDARVSGNARVTDNAWVSGNARVSGDARVSGNARVTDNAWVSGNARVTDNAWVSGDAWVSDNACYTTIKGFGREYRTTTFFRCKDGKVRVQCGCFYGDLKEFRAIVKETHGKSKKAIEYLMIADLMELHFEEKKNDK
ncbi:hypothetical protein [Eubacterium ventriosum]|uniref:hypothetical protein n=1 Tax=Eubacterium ventriosum TaxID=39496 RepID=UPI0026722A12|nr:hypothetical protein [Eubacterium ventriosum]